MYMLFFYYCFLFINEKYFTLVYEFVCSGEVKPLFVDIHKFKVK